MSEVDINVPSGDPAADIAAAPPPDQPMTRGQKFQLVGLVILKRARFILILLAVGLFIGYWDTVMNYWEKWTQPRNVASRELEPGTEFYCPMDPQVIRSTYEPNGDVPKCPICGMPLSIRKKGEAAKLPEGITGRVQISPERIQLAGIKTVAVSYRPVARETKTVGYITFDESRLSSIVSRVDGYVEKLYVDKTFDIVHEGDPLAEIYSPELYSTARELVVATRAEVGEKGTVPISAQHPPGRSGKWGLSPFPLADLAAAARNKLLLLGVSQREIDAIVASGTPSPRLVIRSPRSGYVVAKKIVVGSSVEAKMTLLEVADLSTVWIEADVYEKDIPFLRVGQRVEATIEAAPNRVFTGRFALIYPQVEPTTRTNRIRFELDNPKHELRPGMFATVRIKTPLEDVEPYKSVAAKAGRVVQLTGFRGAEREKGTGPISAKHPSGRSGKLDLYPFPTQYEFLVVPERAIVDTGSKKVVYVEREPGLFEGVEVELGPRDGDSYPVIRGLRAGDKVAAAGGFLIDAETRLNPAAAATYFGASGGPQSSGRPSAPAGPVPSFPSLGKEMPETDRPAPSSSPTPDQRPNAAVTELDEEDLKNIQQLPAADRKLALAQRVCPITGAALGSMGVPVKITLRGQPVFLCCKGCIGKAKRNPDETLKKVAEGSQRQP